MLNFRDVGIPLEGRTAAGGAGNIIAPQTGYSIIITDICATASSTISTMGAGGGNILCYAPAEGCTNFTAPINAGFESGVYSSAGNVSIQYIVRK